MCSNQAAAVVRYSSLITSPCTGRMLFKSHPSYSWACPMCWRCGRRGANRAPTHAARPVGKKSHTTRGVDICDSQIWTTFIKSKKLMSIYLCSVHLQNSLSQNGDWCWCWSVIPLVLPVEHIRPWCFPYVYLKWSSSIPQSRIRTCLVLVCWDSCDFLKCCSAFVRAAAAAVRQVSLTPANTAAASTCF